MRQSGTHGAQLLTWMRDNPALNWMPERLLKPLARDITHDRHFERLFNMVKDMQAGVIPNRPAYMRLSLDIVTQSRIAMLEDSLVLFSGEGTQAARAAILRNDKLFPKHRTTATAMLELLQTYVQAKAARKDQEDRYLPWRLLSVRIASNHAKGDVRAYVKGAAADGTFRHYELAPLIANHGVTTINGKPKAEWLPRVTGQPHVRKMLARGQQIILESMKNGDLGEGRITQVEKSSDSWRSS